MKQDVAALLRWIELLEALPKYGLRPDPDRVRMLKNLAQNAA
jgi:hypothetical protein